MPAQEIVESPKKRNDKAWSIINSKKIYYRKKYPYGHPQKYTAQFVEEEIEPLYKYIQDVQFPTLQGFCLTRGYSSSNISLFCNINKNFAQAVEILKDMQHEVLIERSLKGEFNSGITALMLKNNHGYKDKSDIEHSGKIEGTKINVLAISSESITNGSRIQDNAAPNGSIKVLSKQ